MSYSLDIRDLSVNSMRHLRATVLITGSAIYTPLEDRAGTGSAGTLLAWRDEQIQKP